MGFWKKKKNLSKDVEWLVVGLGNPGSKYAKSRHNIGWMVATSLAEKYKKPVMAFSTIYMHAAMRMEGKLVLDVLPTTYMNNSGEAVKSLMELYNITPEKLIIIVDEYNFPLGRVHAKRGGGDGGHNGISSILYEIDSADFIRLRCGIDKNFGSGELIDYVLSDFKEDEIEKRDAMIKRAVDSIEVIINQGEAKAFSLINSGELWEPKEKPKPKEKPDETQ